MEIGLIDQVAMISGGTKGIGFVIANTLAAEGMKISLCSRTKSDLDKAAAAIEDKHNVRCITYAGDLKKGTDIQSWVDQTVDNFGQIDVLVNNAGVTPPASFTALDADAWRDQFDLKPLGYVETSRMAYNHLKKQKGRIINIIGIAGHQPLGNFMVGGAADSALMNFTKSLADEGAKYGVRTNAISPGFTKTERWEGIVKGAASIMGVEVEQAEEHLVKDIPLARPAEPTEIANVVVFLASNVSSYITGVTIPVDGGATKSI